MKLSEAQRCVLEHAEANGGTFCMWPRGQFTHRIVHRCRNLGLLDEQVEGGVNWGVHYWSLTDSGRAALSEDE